MTRNLKKWLLGSILAGTAAVSVAAWSMGPPPGMDPDPVRMIARMSSSLDLTAEQKTKVESVLAAAKEAGAADRARLQELRTQMMTQRTDFDAPKAHKIADEIGQLTGRMVYLASESWSKVYQELNADQKAKLDSMMAERDARRGRSRQDD